MFLKLSNICWLFPFKKGRKGSQIEFLQPKYEYIANIAAQWPEIWRSGTGGKVGFSIYEKLSFLFRILHHSSGHVVPAETQFNSLNIWLIIDNNCVN